MNISYCDQSTEKVRKVLFDDKAIYYLLHT